MDFEIQIVNRVDEIGPDKWNALGAGQPFTSYRWYRFGETVKAADLPIYIILHDKGTLIARGTFWLTRLEPIPISLALIRKGVESLLQHWPLLICRSAWWSGPSGLCLPDPPLRDRCLKIIAQAAQDQARTYRASFLVIDYLNQVETEWPSWPESYIPVPGFESGSRLSVLWSDFDSYLKSLAQSTRRNYRLHCKRATELGICVKRYPKVTRVNEALALIRNVERYHHTPPNPWARAILENTTMVDATWLAAERDGHLVGCCLLLGEGHTRFLTLLGLDYSVEYVYFQLMYAAIGCAIDEGVRDVRGGGGAYELKRRLGFQLESDNHMLVSTSSPIFQRLGRWLSKLEST